MAWVNDLEKDPAYRKYPSSLDDLLRPRYPVKLTKLQLRASFIPLTIHLPEVPHFGGALP